MALFGWLKRNQPAGDFLQKIETGSNGLPLTDPGSRISIDKIYYFLQTDFESKGYDDALSNPDDSYKSDNIKLIRQDLVILIQQVLTHYEDTLSELEFHIRTRSRAGLVDVVEDLESKKKKITEHITKVRQLQDESKAMTGICERITLSYQRGFNRGLAAISLSRFQ